MSFKRTRAAAISAFLLLAAGPARPEELIRLLRPASAAAAEAEQVLQGTVDVPGVKRLDVEVQPFVSVEAKPPRRYQFDVIGGNFQGRIELFPGMNLVSLRSQGGQVYADHAFFLPASAAGEKDWGRAAAVVFTEPRALRAETDRITVEGVVTRPDTTVLYVLALNSRHFHALKGGTPGGPQPGQIRIQRVPVEDLRFKSSLPLEPGHNVLLARPGPGGATYAETALKSVVRDQSAPGIDLQEPTAEDGALMVRGRLSGRGKAELEVSALVQDPQGGVVWHTFSKKPLQTGPDGVFQERIPLIVGGAAATLKDFPLIRITSGRNTAVKTFLNWPFTPQK